MLWSSDHLHTKPDLEYELAALPEHHRADLNFPWCPVCPSGRLHHECCAMPSVHPQSWRLSSSPASRDHPDLCCSLRFSQYSVAIFTSVLLGLCLAQKIRAPPWAVVNPRRLLSQPSRADVNSLACLPQECSSSTQVLNTGIWRPSQYCYLLL